MEAGVSVLEGAPLNVRKSLVPLAAALATLLLAGPAQAAPSARDAHAAGAKAKRALGASVAAARSGQPDAAAKIARAARLQAKAARVARRAGAHRSATGKARLLRGAAGGVDNAFDSYAALLPEVPPELQEPLAEVLAQLGELRTQLVTELTGFVEDLPPDVREQVLAAIAAFQSDGDLQALIAALTDPAVSAAVQAQLQELITELTGTLQEQLGNLEGLEELLPPGALEQLQTISAQLQTQLEGILGQLTVILTPPAGDPPEVPGDFCAQLQALLEGFGLPVPPGFCPEG
jgi:hypothetical protein